MARIKANNRNQKVVEPSGLWHQPALMNLLADVLIVVAVAGLAWAALNVLQRLPMFPLREVVLTSAPGRVSSEQLEHATRSAVSGNFFTVDLAAARGAIEKLPWVRKASVRRQWPDGLSLTIEEHEAVARWRRLNGDMALVNRQGEVFVAELSEGAISLPQLSGPEGSSAEILTRHGEFTDILAKTSLRIERVTLSPRRAWQIKLDDGIAIELGRDQERHPLVERLNRFVAHYEGVRQRVGSLRVADMRYPNGFVLSGSGTSGPARKEPAGRKS